MSDILCVYYSRTGRTEKAMGEIAQALGAELVKIEDGQDRSKLRGYLRSGYEAMSKKLCPIAPVQTERPLQEYRLVIIGTPAWAGRCASPVKSFLAQNAEKLPQVSCVVTRGGADRCDDVLAHMATFLKRMRLTDVSLRPDDAGYEFWRDKFIQDTKNALGL